jgi:hypothetical protein
MLAVHVGVTDMIAGRAEDCELSHWAEDRRIEVDGKGAARDQSGSARPDLDLSRPAGRRGFVRNLKGESRQSRGEKKEA